MPVSMLKEALLESKDDDEPQDMSRQCLNLTKSY